MTATGLAIDIDSSNLTSDPEFGTLIDSKSVLTQNELRECSEFANQEFPATSLVSPSTNTGLQSISYSRSSDSPYSHNESRYSSFSEDSDKRDSVNQNERKEISRTDSEEFEQWR